jgi:predicted ester cyclase
MMLGLFLWKSQILQQQLRRILSFGGESSLKGGWLPLCPSTFGRGIHVDLKARTGVLPSAGSGSFLPEHPGVGNRVVRRRVLADSEQTINRDCQMVEENKTVVATWLREFWGSSWNPRIINELAAADINLHHQLHEPRRGRASVTRFMTDFREAFPDLCFRRAGDLIAEGNYVVARWEGSGTHTGSAFSDFRMGSLPAASGRKMKFTGTSVFRIDQGRIAEDLGREDALTAMFQLGLIRLPDPQAEALTAMFQAGLLRAPDPAALVNTPGSSLPPGWNNMGGFPGEKVKSN